MHEMRVIGYSEGAFERVCTCGRAWPCRFAAFGGGWDPNTAHDDVAEEAERHALAAADVTGKPDVPGGEHAEHFDPDCEECAYLARPTRETLRAVEAGERRCTCFESAPDDADFSLETTPLGHHQPWCAVEAGEPAGRGEGLRKKAWWEDAHGEVVLLSDALDALELAAQDTRPAVPEAGLDVERLAKALRVEQFAKPWSSLSSPVFQSWDEVYREWAGRILARLTSEEPAP